MIDIIGRLVDRIMNIDNNRTFDRATDSLEAISNAIALIILILGQMGAPETQLYEGWQDELGIDFTLWTVLNPATPWTRGAGAGVAAPFLVATAPLLINEVARLVGNQRWQQAPDTWGLNTILRRSILEFEMTLSDVTQLVPATCFFGLTPNQGDTRASQNIIGFALVGAAPAQALQTVTGVGVNEQVFTGFGENMALYNKFRIDVITPLVAGVATPMIRFYLNEVLIATHVVTVPDTLPDLPMYINYYFDTTALGPCTPQIGIIRKWTEDFQRP